MFIDWLYYIQVTVLGVEFAKIKYYPISALKGVQASV